MCSGTPVLASYSGFRSMVNEAECGFFVDAENVEQLVQMIERIVKEVPIEVLGAMGMAGRRWIFENRTWEGIANDFIEQLYLNNLILERDEGN